MARQHLTEPLEVLEVTEVAEMLVPQIWKSGGRMRHEKRA
jgi:hypothetical protein